MRVVSFASVAVAAAFATRASPQAGTDVRINSDPSNTVQNEIRIAVDHQLPSNLVVAYNDGNAQLAQHPIGVSYSTNGGASWTDLQLSVPPDPYSPGGSFGRIFDPMIAFGPPGNFYVGYIAAAGGNSPASGIFVERSEDGGVTWSGPTTIAVNAGAAGNPDPNYRFNDRCHMASHPGGMVHVVWIKDVGVNLPTSDIYYAFSNPPPGPGGGPFPPTGLNFTVPVTVNDGANGIDFANAPSVAAHPGSRVFVAWIDVDVTVPAATTATIKVDKTTAPTGAPVFGMDVSVATFVPVRKYVSTAFGTADDAQAGSYPAIAVDATDITERTAYIAFAAHGTGADEADIFFTRSTDDGQSWSSPMQVNDDNTTTDQIHPAIVSPADGSIWLAWYDKRNSAPNDNLWDVYLTRSCDRGLSFQPNRRISDASFPSALDAAGTPWLGEYLGIDWDFADGVIAFTKRASDPNGDVYVDRIAAYAVASPFNYCTTSTTTNGCNPTMSSSGTPSATAGSGFFLFASNVEGQKNGTIFYGVSGRDASSWAAGSTSTRCVALPVQRTGTQGSGGSFGACDGLLGLDWNAYIAANPGALGLPLQNGDCAWAQAWFRDPQAAKGTNLSDGLEFAVCP